MKKILYESYEKPSNYAKFKQGDTTIRIVSSGGLYKKHTMKTARGFIPLGNCTEDDLCSHCKSGNEAKIKWVWICLMIENKNVRLLEVGGQIGDAICKIAQRKKKDPTDFDLIVSKTGEGLNTKYSVEAGREYPLSKEDLEFIAPAKKFLVHKYFSPEK